MINKRILVLNQGIEQCGKVDDTKLKYACFKTFKGIRDAVESINESIVELQNRYSKKDANGEPMVIKGVPGVTMDTIIFTDQDAFNKEYKALMLIDSEVTIHKIKEADLPANLTVKQQCLLVDMIEEE